MGTTTKAHALAKLTNRGWVSLQQTARIAGVSYQTILNIRKRGEIKPVKVGGMYRVYEDELIRFLVAGNYVNENTPQAIMNEEVHKS